ncbi:MAG TPA: hypothetical protein VGM75_17360 [Pseudonocardiaceae bacterium]
MAHSAEFGRADTVPLVPSLPSTWELAENLACDRYALLSIRTRRDVKPGGRVRPGRLFMATSGPSRH